MSDNPNIRSVRPQGPLTDLERSEFYLRAAALAQTKGKVSGRQGVAAILGMPASTLESKIRAQRINKFQFRGI